MRPQQGVPHDSQEGVPHDSAQGDEQHVWTGTCFSTVRQTMRQAVYVSWQGTQTVTVRVAW